MIHSGMAADSRFETPDQGAAGRDWRFEGVAEDGRNVIYVLRINPRATTRGIKIDLPWRKEQACPHCFGQGHTLEGDKTGRRMNRIRCEKCDGGGVVTSDATLRVNLTPELLEHGRIRLNGRGHYYPREAIRGDLILEVSVDGNKKPDSSGMYSA
jgi:DnaJ-class molecular chaperone